ncbi:uncharacterized protein DUF397 [Krasilnikovia cinnamomea]|uniref:Uncharacterized protein DUF397 n=1 Tax=Krasilnikovia cinnamomea TaxID=349313 RepID=A0A4Q7ZHL8_9ACTN|nr:DUF397 domain-containing protein [Krasilnikovia cinnamomea]RZU49891.1 uncharacterized protein DUF397 [Krasilnikovia cinnamomea]
MRRLDQNWRTSTRSGTEGNCVEVRLDGETIVVRDSKNRSGPVLRFTDAEWRAFLAGAQDGEFDLPA